jgi:aminopeptidase N
MVLGVGALRAQTPAPEVLRTAGDRPIDIQHIRLDLKVDLPKKTIDARAELWVRSLRPVSGISLDAVDFEVQKVTLAGNKDGEKSLPFSHDGKKLDIELNPPWAAGQTEVIRIAYRIRDPKAGLYFFGPTDVEPEVPLTVWSQGESITNRYWIPCLDQPNQRQTTELVVTVPEGFDVLSNGSLVNTTPNTADKTVTFHWKQDKPHASYLVTLVVGQFDIVKDEWDKVPVLYYVPKGHKEDIQRTFGRTPEMLKFFSERFGIHYPWDKYAQVVVEQFTAGGMENTSATTLTEYALHDQRSMLDGTPDGLISHELGHQWWGDLLTCRDWSHLWLNEGFASYCEALWAEHAEGADEYAYEMWHKSRGAIEGGKDRPVVDRRYPFPDAMFDSRAYPKGAFILHMLRHRLGEDVFWKAIQKYGMDHRLQSVETVDFRKTLEEVSGRDLERFFYDWTERAGSPALEVNTDYLPETKQARVTVKQTQAGEAFHFPLKIVFTYPDGTKGTSFNPGSKTQVFEPEITDKEHTFYVSLPDRPTLVEVDPEQAILAVIKENKSHELWLAQLTAAGSVTARIRAVQHFGQSKAPADREALAKALTTEKFHGVQQEIAAALGESGGDTCRDALLEGLRQENPKVRRACVEALGKFHKDEKVIAALKDLLQKGDATYGVEAAALAAYSRSQATDIVPTLLPWLAKPSHREVIRDAALSGLGNARDLSAMDTLITWTKKGKPRECRSAALRALDQLAKTANPSEEQRGKIVTAVAACLEGEGPRLRGTAIGVLRSLGRSAAPILVTLEDIQLHDPSDRMRELAKNAVDQIRKNEPVPVELTRLREEVEALRHAQELLKEKLEKYEKVERKGSP